IRASSRTTCTLYISIIARVSPTSCEALRLALIPPFHRFVTGSLTMVLKIMLATSHTGCARCGTYPNISRLELTTTRHHLSLCPEGKPCHQGGHRMSRFG